MKAFVIGNGSIGQRHIKNLINLGVNVSAYSYRNSEIIKFNKQKITKIKSDYKKALEENFDFVVIANNTNDHIKVALEAAKLSNNLYIEKPLSNSKDYIDELIKISESKKLIIDSGFMLRSHPNLIWINQFLQSLPLGKLLYASASVGQDLTEWRPSCDYRNSYSAFINKGGGVIFDLIHELDIIYWLLGDIKEICCMTEKVKNLEIETEGVAQIIMRLKTEQIVHVRLDYVRPNYSRKLELVFEKGIIYWDYLKGKVFIEEKGKESLEVNSLPNKFVRNDIFLNHMKSFINKINTPFNELSSNLRDGYEVLKIALASHESATKKKNIYIA